MAIDFTKPATSDNYSTAFTQNIQANQNALAQWLDSGSVSITGTPPTGAKRYNATSSAVEQWSGAAWVVIPFHGLTYNGGSLGVGVSPSFKFDVLTAAVGNGIRYGDGTVSNVMGTAAGPIGVLGTTTSHALGFYTGATVRMTLDTSGRLSIGAPAGIRQLNLGAANPDMTLKSTVASGGAGVSSYYFGNSSNDGVGYVSYDHGGNFMNFGTNGGVERMRIDSSGNVGIGVTPTSKFHVLTTGVQAAQFDGSNASGSRIDFLTSGTARGYVGAGATVVTGATISDFGIASNGNLLFAGPGGVERMRIDSTGKVGIGRTPSSFQLEVAGDALLQPGTGTNNALLRFVNTGGNAYVGLDSSVGGLGGSYSLNVWHGAAFPIVLATSNVERMRIDAGGQLGLGLTPVTSGNNRALLQLLGSANGGIYLGNTANAASNVLDWYDETTTPFTPVAAGAATAGSGTYTQQAGRYTRIGNTVFFRIALAWSAHTGTGNLMVQNLPFAAAASGVMNAPAYVHIIILSTSVTDAIANAAKGKIAAGATEVRATYLNSNSETFVNIPTAATSIYISGSYEV